MRVNKIYKVFLIFLFLVLSGNNFSTVAQTQTDPLKQFAVRGFHIDLRVQVMTMYALKSFAKELAGFGINTLVMEYEATFPYQKHATISNKYAYTRDEIKKFVQYCNGLGIDVIPLQQCFGHVEYILRHGRYSNLAESKQDISQVCPSKTEECRQLFTDFFADMASLHTSKYIHIGGDETRLLGHCEECAKKAEKEGTSKLFADYLKMICEIITGMGKIPVMWADIILKYPDAVNELPKETVFVDWNYGWNINYFGNIPELQKKGVTLWGAPAIRSHPDNWYTIDWQKHFNNQRDFIPYARNAGYQGMIMTSWSTSGLYGFKWDINREVIDMFAIRNVYPLSGFRILIAAYAKALKQAAPINPSAFVVKYAQERFGFSKEESEKFRIALFASPEVIRPENISDKKKINEIKNEIDEACKMMLALKPRTNKKEFEHLRLMLDLRQFYLDSKAVEAVYESDSYSREKKSELLEKLSDLLTKAKKLDRRFSSLNKKFLYPSEIDDQNKIRSQKIRNIYASIRGCQ